MEHRKFHLGKSLLICMLILTLILSVVGYPIALAENNGLLNIMASESRKSLLPYVDVLGVNTTNNNLTVSDSFLEDIDRTLVMGLIGTCEHSYTKDAKGVIDILEWVSNSKFEEQDFEAFVSALNYFFASQGELNSYDNISDKTYVWIDYENLCMVYCWMSDSQQIIVRWYLKEEYVTSLKSETYGTNDNLQQEDDINAIALDGINSLKSYLLNPNSLILYDIHVNFEYGDAPAVFGHYGAENRLGGISDDWFFAQNGTVQFESKYDKAVEAGDNNEILSNGDVAFVKFAVVSGSEAWKICDTKELTLLLK